MSWVDDAKKQAEMIRKEREQEYQRWAIEKKQRNLERRNEIQEILIKYSLGVIVDIDEVTEEAKNQGLDVNGPMVSWTLQESIFVSNNLLPVTVGALHVTENESDPNGQWDADRDYYCYLSWEIIEPISGNRTIIPLGLSLEEVMIDGEEKVLWFSRKITRKGYLYKPTLNALQFKNIIDKWLVSLY